MVNLQVHTTGGVIAPGAALLDIVPSGDALIIEARVDPRDIDVVRWGLPARVRLTAFNQRSAVPMNGRVLSVSADNIIDERTGQAYYLARIKLDKDPATLGTGISLYPRHAGRGHDRHRRTHGARLPARPDQPQHRPLAARGLTLNRGLTLYYRIVIINKLNGV